MEHGQFVGSVLPRVARISIPGIPHATWEADGGLVLDLDISIVNSIVEVDCTMNIYNEITFPYIHMRALDLARAAVDLVAFGSGWGLNVDLHTFIAPDRVRKRLLPCHEGLSHSCTVYKPEQVLSEEGQQSFQNMLLIIFEEPPLFMALHDLTQAITEAHHAPVNCARAIEGLRTMMLPGEPRAKQWARFRDSLNVQEGYVRLITDQSVSARHGQRLFIHGALVREVV